MNSLIEKQDDEIEQKYESLKQEKPNNSIDQLEKQLVSSVYFHQKHDDKNFQKTKKSAQNSINKMDGFEKDMYQAILDSIDVKDHQN